MKIIIALVTLIMSVHLCYAQVIVKDPIMAQQIARESNKEILLVFTGSDWCKPCIQLHNEILNDEIFLNRISTDIVILNLDFPYKKSNQPSKEQQKINDNMAERFNPKGIFPRLILLDNDLNVICPIKYSTKADSDDLIEQLNKYL